MQFEEFDNKIQQAADHHHPTYDEQAWTKMEKLLNQHLPQKKDDKRRIIFFLLLFLLLGGGAMFLFINKAQQPKQSLTNKQSSSLENSSINKTDNTIPEKVEQTIPTIASDKKINEVDNKNELISSPLVVKPSLLKQQEAETIFKNKKGEKSYSPVKNNQNIVVNQSILSKNEKQINNNTPSIESVTKNNTSNNAVHENNNAEKNIISQTEKQVPTSNISQTEDNNKNDKPVNAKTTDKTKKTSAKKTNSFFFTLSMAPDLSGTGVVEKPGTMKLTSGAGMGYTFNKFTLRTGFYSARKVYTASPDEYHPPSSFWNYYPNLKSVDADCKVYEIPLLLSYNFGNSTKQSWSATAGLSSYLMKRETYHYSYKDQLGQPRYKTWTIYNENQHYFSVLTLSAGYQRNINNTFFVSAEPYLKMPLSGVGYGKIKLNSVGFQFSLGANIFGTNKKTGR